MTGRPELLLPAGSMDVLRTAVRYGADAVYLGAGTMGLRAKAKNFTDEELCEAVRYAHDRNVKVYVTANIFAHNEDLRGAEAYFRRMREIAPDALLISDPGLFDVSRQICPEIPVHISTQANNTNYGTFLFWYRLGVRRVVTARELSLAEIREIRERIPADMEIESFVHGAMCISYSGRCLLSSFLAGRDANRGSCAHPCRWQYSVMEEKRPGEYFPVEENERGTYLFNSRDLCMIGHLPELLAAGVGSLKIEGRMKTALYVATAARAYRMAIDLLMRDEAAYEREKPRFEEMVREGTYRDFTTGFYFGKPGPADQVYTGNIYEKSYTFLGTATGCGTDGTVSIRQKNKFLVGDIIEIMKPDGRDIRAEVLSIRSEDGQEMPSAPHPGQKLLLRLSAAAEDGDILRMREGAPAGPC